MAVAACDRPPTCDDLPRAADTDSGEPAVYCAEEPAIEGNVCLADVDALLSERWGSACRDHYEGYWTATADLCAVRPADQCCWVIRDVDTYCAENG